MFPFGFLACVVPGVRDFVQDRGERFCDVWAESFIVGDVDASVEGVGSLTRFVVPLLKDSSRELHARA
ncbi:hypothetical protein ATY41_11795 [Leifsonia xyli subsp. xyli]|uniref:Uncharacterized protein n=1 Tax=Leifsonia xyli subsp. xyli TaxID=59736 RepID=A0A1E2SJ60_LEIXY|nr:hypothetical protein ATY41_11795 [Leifsonia xyli subsp. xyli]